MKPFLKLYLSSLLLIFNAQTFAQQRYPHTLLWRISGKGLSSPSYLFGTMHLNDKRLFRLDDSVYRAIEKTRGLAIEVNPDEMGAYFVNKLFEEMENGKKLKDVLDENYFKKHSNALAQKFNKPADQITSRDIIKEKNKWMSEYLEKGEMPTFVDAYLYNIARKQGKWLGGIEDISDQAGLIDNIVDRSDIDYLLADDSSSARKSDNKNLTEKMIGLYSDQDLEGIEAVTNQRSTPEQKDRMLINRNVKMARRIDSLTALRTMFLAIGAAHLPGDSGVISLLLERGFSVTPVFSTKKIEAKDYTFEEVHLPWIQVNDTQGLYGISMPANPATIKLYGLIEMKFLLDLFNLSSFSTMAYAYPGNSINKDSIVNALALRIFKNKGVHPSKNLENNGVQGKEYMQTVEGSNLRLQIFLDDKAIYIALISALKKEMLSSADADKFFNSFIINKTSLAAATVHPFNDSIIGVSFISPAEVTYNQKLSMKKDSAWKISCFTGTDLSNGALIMLFSKEVKPGYYILSDSIVYDAFYQGIKGQYINIQKEEINIQGSKAIKITGKNIEQPNLFVNAISVVRNNRNIVLLVISDSAHLHSPEIEKTFTSFTLIAHPPANWSTNTSPDSTITCWASSTLRTHTNVSEHKDQILSYDTTTATSYMVIPDTLNKYTWFKSDSSFWKERIDANTGNDILIEQRDILNGETRGKELLIKKNKFGNTYNRVRLLLNGNKLYKLFASGEKEFLYSTDAGKFFTSFRLNTRPVNSNYITSSKAQVLLQDISSKDSSTRQNAFSSIESAPFGKEDLPLLKEALFKVYQSPSKSSQVATINNTLAHLLANLNDPMSVRFVKEKYPTLTKEKGILKNTALTMLEEMHTAESYAAFGELLLLSPPAERLAYPCISGLTDSLPLTAGIYPALQQLAKDTLLAPTLADIAVRLIDSGYLKQELVSLAENDFLNAANQLQPALTTTEDYSDYNLPSLLKLIGRFNTPSSFKLLKTYLSVKNNYLVKEAAMQLLKHDQQLLPVTLHRLAADPPIRSVLYSDLKELKKTALFPRLFLTQAHFAESAIYSAANDEEEMDSINAEFLSKKIASFKGKKYAFYLYKISSKSGGESLTYLGIAGGYDLTGTALQPKEDLTGIYWKEPFDEKSISSFVSAFLKSRAEADEK